MVGVLPAAALAQTCNTADRSVLLILDASGSMNAKLPNGETRIAVAQRAIKGVAGFIPAQAQLSLRMYGAQSPASQKNCQDSNLAVPFGPASASGGAITTTVDGVKAQGYTPIAYSLEQAASDFPADAKERVIVLVSDGKETCQGDPAVAAKALAGKGLTVHTVGFVVDTAARGQLQAIARLHRRLLFRRAGRPGIARYAEVCAQRLQEDRGRAAGETAAREAAHHVRDLAHVSRRAQRGDGPAGRRVRQL
jgi:Ca-activated chloride channel family protein